MNNSKDDSLDREEFEKIWDAAVEGDALDRLIFICAGHLGMRASEIAHMKKDWVDFQRQTINVPKKDGDFKAKSRASARSISQRPCKHRIKAVFRLQ